ncbi:MAG: zinc ribbon domain-containing protein [Planctomycetales bacterium]|nr:zinc ribbon domain-containing protein [Planctomycetales bacterium]
MVDRCPNCRSTRVRDGDVCERCGWIPAPATEMVFVDNTTMRCPVCSAERPGDAECCPCCGAEQRLQSFAANSGVSFHISSLLIATTLLAVCLALMRVVMPLGIIALTITLLAGYRTALLTFERKRLRYPVSDSQAFELFLHSVGGVVLAGAVLVMLLFAWNMALFGMLYALGSGGGSASFFGIMEFGLFMVTGTVVGLLATAPQFWKDLFRGVVAGLLAGAPMLIDNRNEPWLLLPIAAMFLGAMAFLSRRGGAVRARAYCTGLAIALWLESLFQGPPLNEPLFAILCAQLVPILLTMLLMERIWSWEDVFTSDRHPGARHHYAFADAHRPMAIYPQEPVEGIEYLDAPPSTNEHAKQQ